MAPVAKGGGVAGQHEAEAEQRQLRGGPQAGSDLCNAELCDLQAEHGTVSKYRLHIACVQGLHVGIMPPGIIRSVVVATLELAVWSL